MRAKENLIVSIILLSYFPIFPNATNGEIRMIAWILTMIFAIGVLIFAIYVGVYGMGKIHDSYEQEKEEYALKRMLEENKEATV